MNGMRLFRRAIASARYRLIASSGFFSKDLVRDDDCNFGEYTYGSPLIVRGGGGHLSVGKFCSIAESVTIFLGGSHRVDWVTTYPFSVINSDFPDAKEITGHPYSKGDVVIGNDVWIGMGATILSGVSIGNGAVVGARAVVARDVDPYTIFVGNPGKAVRKRFADSDIQYLLDLRWWEWPIEKINDNVRLLCSADLSALRSSFPIEKKL